ncbi:hypothetical protein [Brevibacillus massiliensis]|uniref:hypothetical protein n=1 Tax=Brevibacillus massiliensis TaxID=1118054 RepID=UPI0002DBD99C|nr:hypothetical protein [Brevibacillus massiliensis]
MVKRETKKLLRDHPEFSAWLKQHPDKRETVRKNPASIRQLFSEWQMANRRRRLFTSLDFSQWASKARRISEVLENMNAVMGMMAEDSNKKQGD